MSHPCELSFDADLVMRALRGELGPEGETMREHVLGCEGCSSGLLALTTAKSVFVETTEENAAAARARDARAVRRFRASTARRPARAFALGTLVGGALAAAAAMVLLQRKEPLVHVPTPVASAAVVVAPPPPPEPSSSPVAVARAMVAPKARAMVVKRACASCRSNEAEIAPGVILADHAAVTVPAGSQLLVAFSLAGAVADAASGALIDGPAEVSVADQTLALSRGRARIAASGAVPDAAEPSVRTPHVAVVTARGRVTIDVDDTGSRVTVEDGSAFVTTLLGEERRLAAGERLAIDRDGRPLAAPAAMATKGTTDAPRALADSWTDAMSALERGDRARAERELAAIVRRVDGADPLYRRASFVLAEIELARSDTAAARPRLASLVDGPDAQLAEDAATLLARSYPTAGERAAAWGRYVATAPPPPRRERAILEQVRALVAGGRRTEAHAVAQGCTAPGDPCDEARLASAP